MYNALAQSQVNLSHTSLYRLHCDGRVKAIQAPSLVHLLAAFELLKLSLNGEKVLVILEGLSTLFLAHKVLDRPSGQSDRLNPFCVTAGEGTDTGARPSHQQHAQKHAQSRQQPVRHRDVGELRYAFTLALIAWLTRTAHIDVMVLCSVTSKQSPGLRDGPNAARDPLTLAWKQYVPKLVQYSPT